MATVAQDSKLRRRIEAFLAYLLSRWNAVPNIASEWNEWDRESQTDFILDWPICEDRLGQVREFAENGLLTAEQQGNYDELTRVVAKNRPILERLFQD